MNYCKRHRFVAGLVSSLLSLGLSGVDAQDDRTCDGALSEADKTNASTLWEDAELCARAGDLDSGTFLMLAGQARAMIDLGMLRPATDEDELKAADVYRALYYRYGGLGADEVYRNPERLENLLTVYRQWSPPFTGEYNPGWTYRGNVDEDRYSRELACQKATRLQVMQRRGLVVGNDEYYAAQKEMNELRAANRGAIDMNSEVGRKYAALNDRMREASKDIPYPIAKPEACKFERKYEPDPEADFLNVFAGGNGPDRSGVAVFLTREAVEASWIKRALSEDELNMVLGAVDFEEQMLVAASNGKRVNATGNTFISDVNYNAIHKSLNISLAVGVSVKGCEKPRSVAYPFALAVAPRPELVPNNPSRFMQNFPDGCRTAISGSPTSLREPN